MTPITQRDHDLAELRAFLFNVQRLELLIEALLRDRMEVKSP